MSTHQPRTVTAIAAGMSVYTFTGTYLGKVRSSTTSAIQVGHDDWHTFWLSQDLIHGCDSRGVTLHVADEVVEDWKA